MKFSVDRFGQLCKDTRKHWIYAFGLDKLSLGTAIGFYGTECGAMLSIGGGMFAAMLGISILAKEESLRRFFRQTLSMHH